MARDRGHQGPEFQSRKAKVVDISPCRSAVGVPGGRLSGAVQTGSPMGLKFLTHLA